MGSRLPLAIFIVAITTLLADVAALQTTLDVENILLPGASILQDLFMLFTAVAVLAGGQVVAHALLDAREERLIAGGLALLLVLPLFALGATVLSFSFLFAATLTLFAFQAGEYSGLKGLWSYLGHVRGLGALIVFFIVAFLAYQNPEHYQQAFQHTLFTFALSQAAPGNFNLGAAIDKLVPDTLTPEEQQHVMNAILAEYPNFYQLPPETQQTIEQNFVNMYLNMKREIKKALKAGFSNVSVENMGAELEKSMRSIPLFQTIMEYAGILYALAASFVYSLISWLATVVVFLLGVPVWRRKRVEKGT